MGGLWGVLVSTDDRGVLNWASEHNQQQWMRHNGLSKKTMNMDSNNTGVI
jgi:hypothetical protein